MSWTVIPAPGHPNGTEQANDEVEVLKIPGRAQNQAGRALKAANSFPLYNLCSRADPYTTSNAFRKYIGPCLFLGTAVLIAYLSRREPYYNGKSLSDWVVLMRLSNDVEKRRNARAAVHHLATNSVPILLHWLQHDHQPNLKATLWTFREKAVYWMEARRLIKPKPHSYPIDPKYSYRALAFSAFEELGPEAAPAIPTLIQFLGLKAATTNELNETAGAAYVALRTLAPTSIPALIQALSNHDAQVWALASGALAQMGPQASNALPALRQGLHDPNHLTTVAAAEAMGKLGADPSEFMPVLLQSLREPDPDMLSYTIEVLLRYKDHAHAAVPILQEMLRGIPNSGPRSNTSVHAEISNAIRQIETSPAPNLP